MSWEEAIKISPGPRLPDLNCKVSVCNATRCFWNRNRKCRLKEITVTDTGQCLQYKET